MAGYFTMHSNGRGYQAAPLRVVQGQDQEQEQAREQEQEPTPAPPPQPASEIRRARVRALKLAYESRGLAWNESEALARLAEVEGRGIIR